MSCKICCLAFWNGPFWRMKQAMSQRETGGFMARISAYGTLRKWRLSLAELLHAWADCGYSHKIDYPPAIDTLKKHKKALVFIVEPIDIIK